ncbi:MAG: P63C domain-containing protein [Stellaceae bacterium]
MAGNEEGDEDGVVGRARGGIARAKALSPTERSQIAQQAAAARWHKDLPFATHSGTLKIADLEIECAVLNDGRRVLSQRGVNRALGRKHGGNEFRVRKEGGGELPIFLTPKVLKPFISNELRAVVSNPILYRATDGAALANGIDASAFVMVCEVWVNANTAGALRYNQSATAVRAAALLRGLQHVAIAALIDEATGYQADRPKDELRRILEAYISKELLPWTERFPEEFYREMFRLRGWHFSSAAYDQQGPRGPRYAGKLTKELVYKHLPPGVLEALEKLNPNGSPKGRRKYHHHRFLSGNIGNPHLEKHVAVVTALMRISTSWKSFTRNFNRNFSKQAELDLGDDDRVEA